MKIAVRVKPNSREDAVEKTGDRVFVLRVKARAIDGMANKAAVLLLAKYFGVPKSRILITMGHKSKNKVIEIL